MRVRDLHGAKWIPGVIGVNYGEISQRMMIEKLKIDLEKAHSEFVFESGEVLKIRKLLFDFLRCLMKKTREWPQKSVL